MLALANSQNTPQTPLSVEAPGFLPFFTPPQSPISLPFAAYYTKSFPNPPPNTPICPKMSRRHPFRLSYTGKIAPEVQKFQLHMPFGWMCGCIHMVQPILEFQTSRGDSNCKFKQKFSVIV